MLVLQKGWETWWADGDGNSFWRSLSLNIWRPYGFYRQVELVVLVYAAVNPEALVSKGRHLYDDILYYDEFVVQTFVGTERVTQHERILLAELALPCTDGGWTGRLTACLASKCLSRIAKIIHSVDKKARVKQNSKSVFCGRGRKRLTFGGNRWSKTCVPTDHHTALLVRGAGDKEDTFVEESTVAFT